MIIELLLVFLSPGSSGAGGSNAICGTRPATVGALTARAGLLAAGRAPTGVPAAPELDGPPTLERRQRLAEPEHASLPNLAVQLRLQAAAPRLLEQVAVLLARRLAAVTRRARRRRRRRPVRPAATSGRSM